MEGFENTKWFEITDEAKNQMEKLLEKNPDKYAVSLMVEGGGCAGFKYKWGFIDKKEDLRTNIMSIMCEHVVHAMFFLFMTFHPEYMDATFTL